MKLLLAAIAVAILTGASTPALAQSFERWTTGADEQGATHASVMNESGFILGQYCDSRTGPCYWVLGMSARCKVGTRYPVLVNSDASAQSLEVGCTGETSGRTGIYGLVFTDSETIGSMIARSNRLGIAFPLKGDQFRVVRFDVTGAPAALAAARNATPARPESSAGDSD
jgi:hypothetical protein